MTKNMPSVKKGESTDIKATYVLYAHFMEKSYTFIVNEKTNTKPETTKNNNVLMRYFICELCTKCLGIIRKHPHPQ